MKKKKIISLLSILVGIAFFAIPFSTLNISGIGILIYVFLPLIITFIITAIIRPKRVRRDSSIKALSLFFIYCLWGVLWSPSADFTRLFQVFVLILVIGLYSFNTKEQAIIKFFTILTLLTTCYLIYISSNGLLEDGRASIVIFGIERDPNYVSFIFFPGIAVISKILLDKTNIILKVCAITLIILVLYSELRMGSRGGLFSCIFIIVLSFLLYGKVTIKKIGFAISLFILLAFLFSYATELLPDQVSHRFTKEMVVGDQLGDRLVKWNKLINTLFGDNNYLPILFGFGTASTSYMIRSSAHNFLLQFLFEGGIIGLALLIVFIFKFTKMTIISKNYLSFIIFAGSFFQALSLSVGGIVEFWINIAIAFALFQHKILLESNY